MYPGLPSWFHNALSGSHHVRRVRLLVLDLEMKPVATVTTQLLSWQVNVDLKAEVTRSATFELLDPLGTLHFDSNSPADGALYADRMLRLVYEIRRPTDTAWTGLAIFTGPVTKFSRDGDTVNVECQGKEVLAMGNAWRTHNYQKNAKVTAVILDVMRREGERHFDFPDGIAADLPGDRPISVTDQPWAYVQRLAASIGRQLYYDGAGRLKLRAFPARTVYTFRTGEGGAIRAEPKVTFSTDSVKNTVRVIGKKPKNAKSKVRGVAVAPSTHPLSPQRLGRNGEGRHLVEFVEDDSIGSDKEAKRVAKQRLTGLLAQLVEVEADCFLIPHLDAGDMIGFKTDNFTAKTRLTKFSLGPRGMTIGYHRRAKPKRTKKVRR